LAFWFVSAAAVVVIVIVFVVVFVIVVVVVAAAIAAVVACSDGGSCNYCSILVVIAVAFGVGSGRYENRLVMLYYPPRCTHC